MTRRLMPTPARIEEDTAAREVVLTWADGHVSRYTYRLLRLACPCAVCVHEWTGEKLLDQSRIAADIRPKQIAQVGAYALRFTWSDGHMTGIYPFSLVRSLCQCDACASSTTDGSPMPR